jgi:hypothetical protein
MFSGRDWITSGGQISATSIWYPEIKNFLSFAIL